MFFQLSITFAIVALLGQVAFSSPPACVLQAVNQARKSPTDVKDICAGGSTVEQSLVSDCGNNFDAAMSAFSSICSGVGVTISTWSAASSSATPASTPVSSNAISASATSATVAISNVNSDSSSTSISALASVTSTESAAHSTDNAVTTATGILTATDTVTSTQSAGSSGSSTSSGTVSTGAAEHVEKHELVMGAMAAAGFVMAL